MSEKKAELSSRRRGFRALEWPLLLVLTAAAAGLGFLGFRQYYASVGEPRTALDSLYLALQLFVMESGAVSGSVPWSLEVARFLAPAVTVYAAGKALAMLFRQQLQQFGLRFKRGHAVICGGGRKGLLLSKAFLRRGEAVVVIERDEEADTLTSAAEAGAKILIGDAREGALLRRAGIERAKHLIAVCGDDGSNAEVAIEARQLNASRDGEPLTCVAHLFNPELFRLLRDRWFATQQGEAFELEFFNVFDHGARALLAHHAPFDGEVDASADPHVLIVGMGRLGESLLLQMARRWWYLHGKAEILFPVTVIDRLAARKTGSVISRYPGLEDTCALTTHDLEFPSAEFLTTDFLSGKEGIPSVSSIYVCFDDDSLSLSAALSLHERLQGRPGQAVRIVARMQEEAGLTTLLRREGFAGSEFENLHGFGLLDRTWTLDSVLSGVSETVARALHENYVDNRRASGKANEADASLVSWEALSEEMRQSNRQWALAIRRQLASADCRLEPQRDWREPPLEFSDSEINRLARLEHDRWVAARKAEGWTMGTVKDPDKKTHPWLEPWDQLKDEKEKAKTQVRADMCTLSLALARVGFAVRRN